MAAPPQLPLAILIPARNEQANLDACLAAATASGAAEIWVADDGSTDQTGAIAASWQAADARVRVLAIAEPPPGWAGKNHALWQAAQRATQPWLLFLDADACLLPGGLERAWREIERDGLAALSLSPRQRAEGWVERAVQARVFDLLDRRFPPARINDPADPCAAANGQFILIRRADYFALGGHAAIAGEWLEDVALARRIKAAGLRYRFGDGRDCVATRMYRGWDELAAGWSKNFVGLFGPPTAAGLAPLFAPLAGAGLGLGALITRRPRLAALAAAYVAFEHVRYARRQRRAGREGAAWLLPANALVAAIWWRARRPAQWKGRAAPGPRALPYEDG